MKLTAETLWDFMYTLSEEGVSYNCVRNNLMLDGAFYLTAKAENLIKDIAYVVDFSRYDELNAEYKSLRENFFIFVSEKEIKKFDTKQCALNAIITSGTGSAELITNISDLWIRFNRWSEGMDRCLIRNGSLEELIGFGQQIIPNPFIILDVALNVLAFSDNIPRDDLTFQETIAMGHTPAELVASIVKKRASREYSIDDVNTYEKDEDMVSQYVEISVPVKVDKKNVGIVYVHCSEVAPTQGLYDILDYFAKKLAHYFERNPVNVRLNSVLNEKYEKFFLYLLKHDLSEEEIRGMSLSVGYPTQAVFRIYVFKNTRKEGMDYGYGRVIESFPMEKVFFYEEFVVMISAFVWDNNKEEEHRAINTTRIKRLCTELGMYCGESDKFTSISGIKSAYFQAQKAVSIGIKLLNNKNNINSFSWLKRENERLFQYCRLYLHCMIDSTGEFVPLKDLCMPEVLEMIKNDELKGTDNYKVLYTYLENDRVTTEAAALLHMHRNNVNYRIKRIMELYNLDLNDNEVRFRVRVTFKVLDLMDFSQIK